MTPTQPSQAVETAIACFEEIIAQDDHHAYTARVGLAALRAELARPQAAVGTFDGHAVIEAALKKATKGNLADAPFPMTGEAAQAYLMGLAAAYQHALEMIPASRVPVALPAPSIQELAAGAFYPQVTGFATPAPKQGDAKEARPDSFHSDGGDRDRVQAQPPATRYGDRCGCGKVYASCRICIEQMPRHKFWGAGEPDCPQDIKASNGELHTMRCKVCGDGWRKSTDVCFAAILASKGGAA